VLRAYRFASPAEERELIRMRWTCTSVIIRDWRTEFSGAPGRGGPHKGETENPARRWRTMMDRGTGRDPTTPKEGRGAFFTEAGLQELRRLLAGRALHGSEALCVLEAGSSG